VRIRSRVTGRRTERTLVAAIEHPDPTGAAMSNTDQKKQPATPGPEVARLGVFVGKWKTEGQQHEGPFGPAARFTAVESYEWLPGGFFLVHRLDGTFGDAEAACIEVTGHDAELRHYTACTFYNNGTTNEWHLRERDGAWTLTGTWDVHGEEMQVRCNTLFSENGHTMTATWEYARAGADWRPFLDAKATRV